MTDPRQERTLPTFANAIVSNQNDRGRPPARPSDASTFVEPPYHTTGLEDCKDDSNKSYVGKSSSNSSNSFRASSPPVEWGPKELNRPCPKHGRVGIFQAKAPENGRPNKKLRSMYIQVLNRQALADYLQKTRESSDDVLFHIFHVQNAHWALDMLSKEFGMGKNPTGAEFLKYARYKRQDPGGKPYLMGKSWPLQTNEESGTRQMYLSFDYLKEYCVTDPLSARPNQGADRMTELYRYDDEGNTSYGYDLAVQRLSCFFQHKSTHWMKAVDVVQYMRDEYDDVNALSESIRTEHAKGSHDTDAAIIFEESRSFSVNDTLVPARATAEKNWLRLCKNTTHMDGDVKDDTYFYPKFVRTVLDDIFNHLTRSWESVLDLASEHQTILENKLYDQPADESRASELWINSFQWLRIEKLMAQHKNLAKILKAHANALTEDVRLPAEIKFLSEAPNELDRLSKILESNLVKSTENLITLLYQSVSIRDSRRSFELNASMARLSWITFVFLPLTAVATFFGMNTTWVKDYPDLKWYGILASALFGLVFLVWAIIKFLPAKLKRDRSHQRGSYESFFHSLAVQYPRLWSRVGPREHIIPESRLGKIQWMLIKHWSQPKKTILQPGSSDDDNSDLDSFTRWRRYLIRRWTKKMKVSGAGLTRQIEDGQSDNADLIPAAASPRPTIESVLDTTDSGHNSPYPTTGRHKSTKSATGTRLQKYRRHHLSLSPRRRHNTSPYRNDSLNLSPNGATIVVSEEERADHIARCGRDGKPWWWSGNRKTGSSKEGGWVAKRRVGSFRVQKQQCEREQEQSMSAKSSSALDGTHLSPGLGLDMGMELHVIPPPTPVEVPPPPPPSPQGFPISEPSLRPPDSGRFFHITNQQQQQPVSSSFPSIHNPSATTNDGDHVSDAGVYADDERDEEDHDHDE